MKNRIYNIVGSPRSEVGSRKLEEAGFRLQVSGFRLKERSLQLEAFSPGGIYCYAEFHGTSLQLEKQSSKPEARSPEQENYLKEQTIHAKQDKCNAKQQAKHVKQHNCNAKKQEKHVKEYSCTVKPFNFNAKQRNCNNKKYSCNAKQQAEAGSWKPVAGFRLQVSGFRLKERSLKLEACSPGGIYCYAEFHGTSLKLRKNSSKLIARSSKLSKYNQCNALYLPEKFWVCTTKIEGFSLLPRGSAGFGAIPGAAAITTIISFFVSSPRDVSENAGFTHLAYSLPVINQSTLHQGSFVPQKRGTGFALANQGVKEKIPNNWIEGTKPERRYVTN